MPTRLEIDVYGRGPYRWQAWTGHVQVAGGRAYTRPGLCFAILRARLRWGVRRG